MQLKQYVLSVILYLFWVSERRRQETQTSKEKENTKINHLNIDKHYENQKSQKQLRQVPV